MSMHLPDERALAGIRLIATDVDGTLLETGTPITARVLEAIDAVRETGAHVVPVTGRPLRWICLLYTSPSPRDRQKSRMPSSA